MKNLFFPFRLFKRIFYLFFIPAFIYISAFALSAGYFWGWDLKDLGYFYLFVGLGLALFIGLSAYLFTRQFSFLLRRTYRMSSKFRFILEEQDELGVDEDADLFLEMDRALSRVRSKLLKSRKRLAHELEQVKTLMRNLQDAVVTIGLRGECLFFNSAFATVFLDQSRLKLFQNSELLIEQVFRQPDFLNTVQRVLKEGKAYPLQLEIPNQDGQVLKDYSIKISPLFEEKDKKNVYGAMILFHDISEYLQTEKMRLQFVENASHELRTPLTSVKGYLDIAVDDLRSSRDPAQVLPMLKTASDGVERLVALVNDLLDLSKNDRARDVNTEWINPILLTDKVFQIMSPLAAPKEIQLKMQHGVDIIKLDEAKMEQALINLIANAVKYNPPGTVVTVSWVLSGDGFPLLVVEDNGIGIPHRHWDRLFERFYRIDESRDRSLGGTGLGLAIVKQIIEAHQGSIEVVTPSQSVGTRFEIKFPKSSVKQNLFTKLSQS